MLSEISLRTAAAAQARTVATGIEADLGGDLSTAQHLLVQRAALLGSLVEDYEARYLLDPNSVDEEQRRTWLAAVATLSRLLKQLGLKRVPKPVEDLHEFLTKLNAGDDPPRQGIPGGTPAPSS
jgi:hypothetical protein